MPLKQLKQQLKKAGNKKTAETLQWFFKTGKGDYGEGDKFLGLKVPQIREIAKANKDLTISEIKEALNSKHHEERLCALLILVDKYAKGNDGTKEEIFQFYVANTHKINNWDLVDLTAPKIMGKYLLTHDRKILLMFARFKNLWERRISVLATFEFISKKQISDSLKIAKLLLSDNHDLIHKAVGWMLREIGKRDLKTEEKFLKMHYKKMPRIMLRNAIEKFPAKKRLVYLKGNL